MFTQCPQCRTNHRITARQLRQHRGLFICKACKTQFDALQSISDTAPKKKRYQQRETELQALFEPARPTNSRIAWSAGLGIAILLLLGQFIYFEGGHLAQNPALRPTLAGICSALGCELPDYRNIAELEILHSELQQQSDNHYRLRAAIVNQAGFAQPYPQLKLNLADVNGENFAARIFTPQDYLQQQPQASIASGGAVEIGIDIAAPDEPVGGFTIELI